jgi:hypothetical protein
MSEQPRQTASARPPKVHRAVPVARGYGRDALVRAVEALAAAGVEYEVAEEMGGESPGPWRIAVAVESAPRAIAALAALGQEPADSTPRRGEPAPGPLFQSSSGSLLRLLAMALCFALALWLALA